MESKLTIFFENPFWVGIFEKIENQDYYSAKVVFGQEPKETEVFEMIKKNIKLEFIHSKIEKKQVLKINFKKIKKEAEIDLRTKKRISKAQQIIKKGYEEKKKEQKIILKKSKDEKERSKFKIRQEKKREKHKGH